ncbi:MAG: cytochrome c3 family protein, partial [Bacillota bacterium]
HYEDHTLHNKKNPYGLRSTVVSDWTGGPSPGHIETILSTVIDPNTGEEVPAYKEFCWQCHGPDSGPNATRKILGDKRTSFVDKPHASLEREGSDNPYGPGMDIACLKCHFSHASSNIRLIRTLIDGVAIDAAADTGKIYACMACHDGSPGGADISAKYNAPSSGGHYIKSDPTKKLLCTECHDPHGTTSKKYLLDTSNKYQTGITFPANYTTPGAMRDFCLACHPLSGDPNRPNQVYDTVYTIKVGTVTIQQLPNTVSDHVYGGGTRECAICHDPHKPWPATGGEDKCYSCHSRPNGEATDIKALMGLESQPGTGKVSRHKITDADTTNNTCMQRCHTAHPHDPRSDHIKLLLPDLNEKSLCLNCHDVNADPSIRSPYTIEKAKYDGKKHDYTIAIRNYPADNSTFFGNCDKCHTPHGSDFRPLLRLRKDELCVNCHNGVAKDANGDVIKDIKTLYDKSGHKYVNYPTAKLYCDECHIPHGSTNDKYIRDNDNYAPMQTMTAHVDSTVYQVYFPGNLTGASYKTRELCIRCHREYVAAGVYSYVYYTSETTPGGEVRLQSIPLVGDHGVQINEHKAGDAKQCTDCHNPHDPEPVGSDKDCFICHGANGYATKIEPLTGLNGVWPEGTVAKVTYHPIKDASTQTTNDCMSMCHTQHVHNPRANLIKDKRFTAGDVTAPDAPSAPSVVGSSAIQLDLSWTASASTDVFGYYIYRKVGSGGSYTKYGVVNSKVYAPAKVWFYDGGLVPGQTYYYKVSAFDYNGNESGQSAEVSRAPAMADDIQAPSIPTNLKVTTPTDAASTRLTVSWTGSTDNYKVVQYQVYRSTTQDGTYTLIGSTGLVNMTDSGLQPETGYYYKVRSVDYNGNMSELTAPVYGATAAAEAQITAGSYSEGTEIMELRDANNKVTNEFGLGASIKVIVKSDDPDIPNPPSNPSVAKIKLKNHLNILLQEFTSYTHEKSGSTHIFTFTILLPDSLYSGVYRLETEITHTGVSLVPYEAIRVGATAKGFKLYNDAARTKQLLVFAPGDTVYVKVFTDYPGGTSYVNPSLTYKNFNSTTGTSLTITWESPAYEYGFGKFRFTVPSTGLTNGWWYILNFYGESNSKRNPKVADYGTMFLVKPKDTTPPGQPGVLSFTPTHNTVSVSWTASTGDVAAYNIYRRSASESSFLLIGSTTSTGFTDYGLKPGTTYYYEVKAVDLYANLSSASTGSTATNAAPNDTIPPNKPTNFRVQRDSSSQLSAYWANSNEAVDETVGYAVYRSQNNSEYLRVGVSVNKQYSDTGLKGNTLYYYKVSAYDRAGNDSGLTFESSMTTARSGENSKEGALCMSCHEYGKTPPVGYTVYHKIYNSYNYSKHNVDYAVYTFKDGSVYEGNCTKCHVPHGSDYVHLLKAADDNNLCFGCHYAASNTGKFSGQRYFEESSHGKTTATGEHSTTPGYWPGGDGVPAREPADAGRCYNCHAPHGRFDPATGQYIRSSAWRGNSINLNPLCYTCHTDVNKYGEYGGKTVYEATYHGNSAKNAKMKLDSTYGSGECANCHEPHGGPYPGMLRYPVNVTGSDKNKLCLVCHDRSDILLDTGLFDGSAVYVNSKHNLSAQWFEELNTTGGMVYNKTSFLPGVCLNCHNSHGRTSDGSTDTTKVLPKMLVVNDSSNSEICNKCHEYPTIASVTVGYPGFITFSQGVHKAKAQWPGGKYYKEANTADQKGKCINCHDPHGTAEIDAWGNVTNITGNVFDWEEQLCYSCHDGNTAASNLKFWEDQGIGHLPGSTSLLHSFGEDIKTSQRHVECLDCHNVHSVQDIVYTAGQDVTTRLSAAFKGVTGVKVLSMPQPFTPNPSDSNWSNEPYKLTGYSYEVVSDVYKEDPIQREYMVCFKCHSTYSAASTGGRRVIVYMNVYNASTHGWDFRPKSNFNNPYLAGRPAGSDAWTNNSIAKPFRDRTRFNMTCSDCHGNPDTSGGKPRGPHGSNYDYILRENPRDPAFCNLCHNPAWYGSSVAGDAGTGHTSVPKTHGTSNHFGERQINGNWNAMDQFATAFGQNWCRFCHFAGYKSASTKYPTVHGSNAALAYDDEANPGSYKATRGTNGFLISRIKRSATPSCWGGYSSTTDYNCNHNGSYKAYQ